MPPTIGHTDQQGVAMSTPTYVVGTGRCGSTMLSNMLREHPKVLSISEFFGFVREHADAFSPDLMEAL